MKPLEILRGQQLNNETHERHRHIVLSKNASSFHKSGSYRYEAGKLAARLCSS